MHRSFLITWRGELTAITDCCLAADRIAIDVEANGLYAFRAKLCVVQVAWQEGRQLNVAVIDPFSVDISLLAPALAPDGPVKVLHDLTFDVRMLQQLGLEVGNVRDTSVAARFLGEPATGLAALVKSRFDVELSKKLQDHDWSERPFTIAQIDYLVGDVRHLLALDKELEAEAEQLGISEEIALECGYKLMTASRPPRETAPAYARIKGYRALGPESKAVLRRLVEAREQLAERADKPPFRIAANGLLLEMARRKPSAEAAIRRLCRRRSTAKHARKWLEAIGRGLEDGHVPAEPQSKKPRSQLPREQILLRNKIDGTLSRWRRAEAEQRGVDMQVVLPGHCTGAVIGALANHPPTDPGGPALLLEALSAVEGFGACRVARYGTALTDIAAAAHARRARQEERAPPQRLRSED